MTSHSSDPVRRSIAVAWAVRCLGPCLGRGRRPPRSRCRRPGPVSSSMGHSQAHTPRRRLTSRAVTPDHWMGAPRGQASRGDASSSPSALDSPRCEIFPGERRERGRRPALHLSPTRALYVPQGMSKVGVSERGSLATLPAAAGVVHDHSGNGCYRHTSIHTYSCRGGRTNEVEQADESRATACREAS